ncbi:MAG: aminoacyl-tRNA hydrolase [Alphaproteobacteria bacterium PRO2]|nr:aminoacyl-tRNA hydrolase [Alphaproteobacteria bacterium PRO2]
MLGFKKKTNDAWLIAGLGNPGDKYARNRHNIGFMAAQKIADTYGFPPFKSKYKGLIAEGSIKGRKVILILPQTYMNVSGESVQPAAKFYKIPPEKIIALYDEIELPPGKMRVKKGGGNAGHNGLKSLDEHLPGTDYWRVRLGVGRPPHKEMDVADYVLGNFAAEDDKWLGGLLKAVAEHVPQLLDGKDSEFMNKVTLDTKKD